MMSLRNSEIEAIHILIQGESHESERKVLAIHLFILKVELILKQTFYPGWTLFQKEGNSEMAHSNAPS